MPLAVTVLPQIQLKRVFHAIFSVMSLCHPSLYPSRYPILQTFLCVSRETKASVVVQVFNLCTLSLRTACSTR